MNTQIPEYRAKKIDSDEYIEGFYYKSIAGYTREFHSILRGNIEYDGSITPDSIFEIDPSTLTVSFDNGITWRNFEVINLALKAHDEEFNKIINSMGYERQGETKWTFQQ